MSVRQTQFESERISGTFGTTGVRMRAKSTRILTRSFAIGPKVPWSGEQTLVPGVRPVTQRDRLEWKMTLPKAGTRAQKPCDLGLFDVNARNQLDLIDLIQATQQKDT